MLLGKENQIYTTARIIWWILSVFKKPLTEKVEAIILSEMPNTKNLHLILTIQKIMLKLDGGSTMRSGESFSIQGSKELEHTITWKTSQSLKENAYYAHIK